MRLETDDIFEEIADDLIIYLKAGSINVNSFLNKVNLNINNLEQLLRIHFVLSPEVIVFITKLAENLRRIKTSTRNIVEILNGRIKGRINWQDTFKERYQKNYLDKTIYSCVQRDKNFNIKENLVLKRLLEIIISTVKEDIIPVKNYKWLGEWHEEKQLYEKLMRIYKRNVYLNRIDTRGIIITDRMINDTMKSRNTLYRRAAKLLALYRKLINPFYWQNETVRQEIKKLLQKTFIRPESEDVLFELYWVFKLIEGYDDVEFNLVDGKDNMVAAWEDRNYSYQLFHDSEGSRKIQFRIKLTEVKDSNNQYLERVYKSREQFINLSREIFAADKSSAFWQGRPDIILEIRYKENKELKEIYIGEVKNTCNKTYAMEGLKELLDYMVLVKESQAYISNDEVSDGKVKGILCLNDVEVNVEKVGNVRVLCGRNKVFK